MYRNIVELTGEVLERDILRYTPAGIPLLQFKLAHVSDQLEADIKRQVKCEISVIAVADVAAYAHPLINNGDAIFVQGFLAQKSNTNPKLVLHVNELKLIERG